MTMKTSPVLRKSVHGYQWKDDGYPGLPMSFKIWIDDPYSDRVRMRVSTLMGGSERIVELNDVDAKEMLPALKRILALHVRPETDPDWIHVFLSECSLRHGIDVEDLNGRRLLIPAISNSEIEDMVDSIIADDHETSKQSKKTLKYINAILFPLTAAVLCGKFAKIF